MTKVYVETSALGFYFDDRSPRERDAVRALLARIERGELEGLTSEATLDEVREAPSALATRLLEVLERTGVRVVGVSREAEELAEAYLAAGIIPRTFENDAVHVAVSVLSGVDVIASNNLKHLANYRAVESVNNLNRGRGLSPIDIRTPEALL